MARYRIVGLVKDKSKLLGYVVLNENIKKAIAITTEQMQGLFQQTDFVNAVFDKGELKCTENATSRLPEFTKELKPIDKKPSLFIIAKLVEKENGEIVGFRVINSNDCVSSGVVKEYNISYQEFVKMIMNGTNIVNGKLVNNTTIKAIRGTFEEIVLEPKENKIKINENKENKEEVDEKHERELRKRQAKEYRKRQHLDNVVKSVMTKINAGRPVNKLSYSYQCANIKINLEFILKEIYIPHKNSFSEKDFGTMNKLYFVIIEYLNHIEQTYDIKVDGLGDIEYYLSYRKSNKEDLDRLKVIRLQLFAFLSYLFDVYNQPVRYLNRKVTDRIYCVQKGIGTKKFIGSCEQYDNKTKRKILCTTVNYWQNEDKIHFSDEEDLRALGYTLNKYEDNVKIKKISYNQSTNGNLIYLDFDGYEELFEDSSCIGDYLLPYNIIKSIEWLSRNKEYYDIAGIIKLLGRIEVKLAVLALYNPKKAKMVYDMCTNNGTDIKNWYFLPNFNYDAPSKLSKNDIINAMFYRSGGNIVKKATKDKEYNITDYVNLKRHKVDCSKELEPLVNEVKNIVSSRCGDIKEAIQWVHLIPRTIYE